MEFKGIHGYLSVFMGIQGTGQGYTGVFKGIQG